MEQLTLSAAAFHARTSAWLDATELAPRWVLIENVPGLLSSNEGRDMGTVLGALGDRGYGYAWRILDSQFFGVPQRRRRVFIVGRAGGVCPPQVLFEPESLPGDSPPSRKTGTRVAASLTRGAESAGKGGYAGRRREDDVNVVEGFQLHGSNVGPPGTLTAGGSFGSGSAFGVVNALRSSDGGPDDNRAQAGHLIIEGDSVASTPDLPRLRAGCGRAGEAAIIAPTLMAESYSPTKCQEGDEANWTVLAHTLRAEGHDASEDGTGRGTPIVPQAVGFSLNQRREGRLSDKSDALHQPSGTQMSGVLALQGGGKTSQGSKGSGFKEEQSFTLNLVDTHGVADGGFVPRRLTPRECERLQNFPDDWTRYDSEGKEIADSPRYRMLGNAVTVSVARWIGERIMEAS